MHTSVVEVGTRVCRNIDEAREDIYELRREMIKLASEHGLELVAGATHPFADWRTQEIYPDPRYHQVVKDLQLVARANLIFGLHVHVGIEDREAAIRIMNSMRYFLPHIMALATNSPFWLGLNTGYKGYRAKVFENFPRTGIPDAFSSYSEFDNYVSLLVRTNCIDNAKKIWWDIRPHPFFDTVEVRACDIPLRAEETVAIAALIQATAAYLYRLHEANQDFRHYARSLHRRKTNSAPSATASTASSSTSASSRRFPSAISSRSISPSSIPRSTSSAAAKPSTASARS